MSKAKKCLLVCLISAFALAASFAVMQIIPARAEPVSIEIGVNELATEGEGDVLNVIAGSASSGGLTTSGDNGNKITVEVQPDVGLEVTATPIEGYIFQSWSTAEGTGAASSAVSVKATDTFTYDECAAFGGKLYANFAQDFSGTERAAAQTLKIDYDDKLGDVYMFLGKSDVDKDDLLTHGIKIEKGQEYKIPYGCTHRYISSSDRHMYTYAANSFMLAAIPKESVQSTLAGGQTTTAVFKAWKAKYSKVEKISSSAPAFNSEFYEEPTDLPLYCDRISGSTSGGDTWTGSASSSKELGAEWFASQVQLNTTYNSTAWYATNKDGMKGWYFKNVQPGIANYLYMNAQSLVAEFEEVAVVPQITVTPAIEGGAAEPTVSTSVETTVKIPYGKVNSLSVTISDLSLIEESYTVSVQKERKLVENGFEEDNSVSVENIGGKYVFTVNDIDVNINIIVTPNYGDNYTVAPLVIKVRFEDEQGLQKLISDKSADVETLSVEDQKDWYLDPQYNGADSLAFTSGASYPEEVKKTETKTVSQLHFRVKGSGTFTFEFFLNGIDWGISLAAYRFDSPFTVSDFTYSGLTSSATKNAKALAEGNSSVTLGYNYRECKIYAENGVTALAGHEHWYYATIKIEGKGDEETTDIYIAHLTSDDDCGMSDSVSTPYKSQTVMSIRKVAFYRGNVNVNWGIYNNEDGDKTALGTVTATVDGEIQSEQPYLTESGKQITFKITPSGSYKFYGWSDGENFLSADEEFTCIVYGNGGKEAAQTYIYAVVTSTDDASTYAFRNGGKFYLANELGKALKNITVSSQVYVLKSVSVSEDIEIPKGVELILPYNGEGSYYSVGMDNSAHPNAEGITNSGATLSWQNETYKTPYITFTYSGTMTVKGTLRVGAVVSHPSQGYAGHTSGAYSKFVNNGTVNVDDGGYFEIFGLVTGTGSIEVKKGGKLKQPFLVLDFSGGTNTLALYLAGQTPFNRYAMVNVQCEGGITVDYMGELLGQASLYAMDQTNVASAPVISYKTGAADSTVRGLITLTEGGKAKIVYKEENGVTTTAKNGTQWIGKTVLTLSGGATANYMSLNVGFPISTDVVTAFAVPYNFEIILESGEYALNGSFKLMPGASLTVNSGATLDINKNFFVYDGFVQSAMSGAYYPKADQLSGAGYKTNANFIVDGKLNINESAWFVGVVQTNGTGEIVIKNGANLGGKIVEGTKTANDCNYAEFEGSARVWDKAHGDGVLAQLQAGKTYNAVDNTAFKLPSIEIKYDPLEGSSGHDDTHSKLTAANTKEVEGLKGSWKVKHDGIDHSYDWTLKDNEKPDDGNRVKTVTRQCAEVGCTETHTKTVLYVPESLGAVTFKNAAYTQEEIKAQLFDKYYGTSFADGFSAELSLVGDDHTAAGVCQVKVTLTDGYFYGESLEEEHTFNYTISPYEIKQNEAAVNGTSFVFKNDQWQPTVTVTVNGKVLGDGEYEISEYGENIHVGDGTVTVKGTGNYSGEVTLTFQITAKSAKVTVLGTGVKQGDTPKAPYNIAIEDFLGEYNDKDKIYGMLDFDIAAPDQQTAGNSFTVTPKLKAGQSLSDYTVQWVAGTFTIYDYAGIEFSGDTNVTYDGYGHALTVTGLDDGDNAVLTYTKTDGGVGSTEAPTEAGAYTVTAKITFGDGREENTIQTTLNIAKRSISEAQVTVNVPDGGYVYNRESFTPEVTVTLTGLKEGVVVTFEKGYDKNNVAGTATVTVTGTGNFTDSATGSFEISKAKITVNIAPKTSEYGEDLAPLTFDYTGVYEGDSIDVESKVSLSTTATKFSSVDGSYTISATITNDLANYEIVAADAAYTLTARNITVTIQNQNAAFSNSAPAVVQSMYSVSENGIVNDDDLEITLTAAFNGNYVHGEYTISGVCGNQNYNVSWVEGSFTIDKLDIGDTLSLYIEGATDGENNTLNATYKGEALALVGLATSDLEAGKHINVVCSPAEIDSLGTVQVTLTIEEDNYCGEKQITVIVTDEKGYNNDIREALRDLEVLTQGIDVNNLTEADFAKLKQARQRIDQLSEEDRELAASDLQKYEDMIAGWNNSNSVPDEVIETAKAVADAPVAGLFVTINAALALAYVVSKGVKLL